MTTPALEARDLYRFFHAGAEETLALRGVSLQAHSGTVVAVVGPSGSGKSTLLACLAGLDDPDGGAVHIGGERMSRVPEATRARLRATSIGVLLQSHNLLEHLTVRQNLQMVCRLAGRRSKPSTEDLLRRLGIKGRADAYPASLSGGEAARAGLAAALVTEPPVLLADEPTGELDAAAAAEVTGLLREQADRGVAVVVVSHSEDLALSADRVITLHDGRVVS